MNIVARAKALLVTPRQEWSAIDGEPLILSELLVGYVLPLAAIGPIARFIGYSIFGFGPFRMSIGWGISQAITTFVLAVIGVFILAWVINALAPNFGATPDMPQAIKLSAYSMTAAWVAGIFYLIPALSILALIGALYSLYLFWIGLPILMKSPPEKTATYALVVIVALIVVYAVLGWVVSRMGFYSM